jgi:hypothetical protein
LIATIGRTPFGVRRGPTLAAATLRGAPANLAGCLGRTGGDGDEAPWPTIGR